MILRIKGLTGFLYYENNPVNPINLFNSGSRLYIPLPFFTTNFLDLIK